MSKWPIFFLPLCICFFVAQDSGKTHDFNTGVIVSDSFTTDADTIMQVAGRTGVETKNGFAIARRT